MWPGGRRCGRWLPWWLRPRRWPSAALPGVSGGELQALGLTVVLGHGLPGAWRAPIRHRGDTALLGVWLLGLLGVLAQPWVGRWGLAYVPGWGVGVLELLIGAGLLTATMLACVWADTRHRSGGGRPPLRQRHRSGRPACVRGRLRAAAV